MAVASGSTGSATPKQRIELNAHRGFMVGLWLGSMPFLLLMTTVFVFAARKGQWTLLDVFVLSLPVTLVPWLILIGTTRFVFGRGPVVIVDKTAITIPRLGLSIDRSEVRSVHDGGLIWAKGSGVNIHLATCDIRRLKAWLLFPAMAATPSALRIALRPLAGGVPENRARLLEILRSPVVRRTEERASIRSDAVSTASNVEAQ